MHLLSRPSQPNCLAQYSPGCNQWSDLTPEDKADIRKSLEEMQGPLCAYCERNIDSDSQGHIEHFRQKSSASIGVNLAVTHS